jgi:hypothetical protein
MQRRTSHLEIWSDDQQQAEFIALLPLLIELRYRQVCAFVVLICFVPNPPQQSRRLPLWSQTSRIQIRVKPSTACITLARPIRPNYLVTPSIPVDLALEHSKERQRGRRFLSLAMLA